MAPVKKQRALRFLVREAQKAGAALSNVILGKPKRRTPARYVKGIKDGRFFRYKIQEKQTPEKVSKLPNIGPQTAPKPLINVPPPPPPMPQTNLTAAETIRSSRAYGWLKENLAVIILNFGSICTLTGFTRSDVLELRSFSMLGSISSVVYFFSLAPLKLVPILWSSVFASVNGFKIMQILSERTGEVVLTEKDEGIFVEHFMPHGVTPKQFEKITSKAKTIQYKKGDHIIKQGDRVDFVALIINGQTRASVYGRRMSAISAAPGNKRIKEGGDSGAWMGEMTFLQRFQEKELKLRNKGKKQAQQEEDAVPFNGRRLETALYTIVVIEDCEVLIWSHEEVEQLMHQSTDMRAAMTRAMTAPIVGKVINFTLSMTNSKPLWSTWLDDWKHSGAPVKIVENKVNSQKIVQNKVNSQKIVQNKVNSQEEEADAAVEPVM